MNSFDITPHCEEFYCNEVCFEDVMAEINAEKTERKIKELKNIQNTIFSEVKLYCVETPSCETYQFSTAQERNEWLKIEWELNCLEDGTSIKEYSFNEFKKSCHLFVTNYLVKNRFNRKEFYGID